MKKKKNYILAKLEFWSLNYLDSITLVPWLKFDLFWPLNFSLLHILVLSVSFNSKTLGFLHFLLEFFWDSCCWRLMEMIWRWKRGEENEENLTFFCWKSWNHRKKNHRCKQESKHKSTHVGDTHRYPYWNE